MYGTHLVPSKRCLSLKVLDKLSLQLNEPAARQTWSGKGTTYLADNENGVVTQLSSTFMCVKFIAERSAASISPGVTGILMQRVKQAE